MDPTADAPVRRRRRGAELEAALLEAAWEELVATGFARLTMESTAARAGTGVAVLYRRWANKDELVLAALEHHRATHPVELPETGTLRGDLVAALTTMARARTAFFAVAAAAVVSGLLDGSGRTPAQVRDRILGDQRLSRVDALYRRAHDRGEIDLDAVPPAVRAMPFDLVRHDLLMDLAPPSEDRITAIVDDLVMPLLMRTRELSADGEVGRRREA